MGQPDASPADREEAVAGERTQSGVGDAVCWRDDVLGEPLPAPNEPPVDAHGYLRRLSLPLPSSAATAANDGAPSSRGSTTSASASTFLLGLAPAAGGLALRVGVGANCWGGSMFWQHSDGRCVSDRSVV